MTSPRDFERAVDELFREARPGDRRGMDELVPIVYEELRTLAHRHLVREPPGHTLPTTALVHEAYLRLSQTEALAWVDRNHFLSFVSRLMRRVLIDHARARARAKRGGGRVQVTLRAGDAIIEENLDGLLALDEALTVLEARSERQVRVVECRFFAGFDIEETAEALGISRSSVKRDWCQARAWLNRRLSPGTGEDVS